MESIDNRFTYLAGLIEQAQVGGVTDRLLNHCGVNDELAPMCRWLLITGRRFGVITGYDFAASRGLRLIVIRSGFWLLMI